MKISLINPSCSREEGRDLYMAETIGPLFSAAPFRKMNFGIPLALPTLAAHTPPNHHVRIIDEEIEKIPFKEPVDLVGITAMTFKATRGYAIAKEFRSRGAKVVMGGVHATICSDEALEHVDAVVIGEAEDVWDQVLMDVENNCLKQIYKSDTFLDLKKARPPRYDLVKNRNYLYTYLQTTRGCPFDCNFCTVTKYYGRTLRKKYPEQVIHELETILDLNLQRTLPVRDKISRKKKTFLRTIAFIDDNFAIDRNHAIAVCEALIRYQEKKNIFIPWYTQVNISVGLDKELLSLMKRSNCSHLFVGLEDVDPTTLKNMNKKMNLPDSYEEAISNIHEKGIRVVASMIVGEKNTSWQTAERLKSFSEENHVFQILVNILTPFPGTRIREEMEAQERIITRDHQKYNIRNVVYRPEGLSKAQLEEIYLWLCNTFYRYKEMFRRGRPLLSKASDPVLPFIYRLFIVFGFSFTLWLHTFLGRIHLPTALRAMFVGPWIILAKGTVYAMELVFVSIDYDQFAIEETKRLFREFKRKKNREWDFKLEKKLSEFPKDNSAPIKKYKAFYLDSSLHGKHGIPIARENIGRPLLILGGTSIPISERKDFTNYLFESGYEVATIENPTGRPFDITIDSPKERPESLQNFLEYLIHEKSIQKIDIAAQSYSAVEVIRVLLKNPEKYHPYIGMIIFINPPGFDEKNNITKHCWRFLWGHVIKGLMKAKSRHPDKYFFRKRERKGISTWTVKSLTNLPRTFREVRDIVRYRSKPVIKDLVDRGFNVCFFLQNDDAVVPPHITEMQAKQIVPPQKIRIVDGGHNDLFYQSWKRPEFLNFLEEMKAYQGNRKN